MLIYSTRARPQIKLSEEQKEYRALLQKDWARYQREQKIELHRVCLRIQQSQQRALNELRAESEELYQAAVQPDEILLPITVKGPTYTPPIKNYDVPAEYRFPLEPTIIIIIIEMNQKHKSHPTLFALHAIISLRHLN